MDGHPVLPDTTTKTLDMLPHYPKTLAFNLQRMIYLSFPIKYFNAK